MKHIIKSLVILLVLFVSFFCTACNGREITEPTKNPTAFPTTSKQTSLSETSEVTAVSQVSELAAQMTSFFEQEKLQMNEIKNGLLAQPVRNFDLLVGTDGIVSINDSNLQTTQLPQSMQQTITDFLSECEDTFSEYEVSIMMDDSDGKRVLLIYFERFSAMAEYAFFVDGYYKIPSSIPLQEQALANDWYLFWAETNTGIDGY
jgi:hypothetical protein